jgi:hypothetical protein
MRTVLYLFIASLLFGCNNEKKSSEAEGSKTRAAALNTHGYTLAYETNYTIDNNANSETVLSLYRDWDNNTLANSKASFADSVMLVLSDGTIINGARDSVFSAMANFRNMYTTVKSSVHAILGAKATDKGEDWVMIWAREVHTDNSGKTDSTELQETWRFNKNGKVDVLYQYSQAIQPPK